MLAPKTEFKPVRRLQSARPTTQSVVTSLADATTSNLSEARFWAESFGLGPASYANSKTPVYAHVRKATLEAGSASVVHQVVFGPKSTASGTGSQSQPVLAVICGPRVQLYGTTSQSPLQRHLGKIGGGSTTKDVLIAADRQISTGGHLAFAAAFRHDERLLAIGTESGQIKVVDVSTRATLTTFLTVNRLPIRSLAWFRNGQYLLAAGDDACLRVWDLKRSTAGASSAAGAEDASLVCCQGHGDIIRSAVVWQSNRRDSSKWPVSALAATGSYDGTVRIWNMNQLEEDDSERNNNVISSSDRCLSVLEHGSPVEALLLTASSNSSFPVWLLSAGGTAVKVWNPLTGACVCSCSVQHRKTVTSLVAVPRRIGDPITNNADSNNARTVSMRIVTAGIDGLIRIHAWDSRTGQLKQLHGFELRGDTMQDSENDSNSNLVPITALTVNSSGDRLAIGTSTGVVRVRQKGPSIQRHKSKQLPRAGTYAFFTRGMNANPSHGDYVVNGGNRGKKRKLSTYDKALREFRYGDALDDALETRNPQSVVAVLEELGKRRGLTIALSNRDEETLESILSFTVRYISRPSFSAILIGVTHKLLEIYGNLAGQSETIDELFAKLKMNVKKECNAQKTLMRLVGQLDTVMASAEIENELL